MASDVATITSQWTDDFAMIPAAGPIVRGRAANVEMVERGNEQISALEPLKYEVEFEEIEVVGDYAFEWGTYRGASRPRAGGETISYSGKLMRILQRQPDGSWKMHRTMVTVDSPAP
jgi:ketosteroid isomerase-like protein